MPYVGREPEHGRFAKLDQINSGFNGSATTFDTKVDTIAVYATNPQNLMISLGGVIQNPGTDYTISGSTITFTTAPATSTEFFGIMLGDVLDIGTPSDLAVTTGKIAASAVTTAKIADDAITNAKLADMAANTIKVRNANSSGDPSDLALADTQILIGDGTGFTAAALSGDITMTNAGVTTIGTDAVDIAMLSATGCATSSTFLRGDNQWAAPAGGVSLCGSTDNTIATVTGACALKGEANLLFDGTGLGIGAAPSTRGQVVLAGSKATGQNSGGITADGLTINYSGCNQQMAVFVASANASDVTFAKGCYTGMRAGGLLIDGTGMTSSGSGTIAEAALILLGVDPTIGTNNYAIFGDNGSGQVAMDDGSVCRPTYSFYNDNDTGIYRPNANALGIATVGTEKARIACSIVHIGDSTNAKMSAGLNINQSTHDDEILTLKSSDVAHGVTCLTETDTFFSIRKGSSTQGGAFMRIGSDGTVGWRSQTIITGCANTSKDSGAVGIIDFRAGRASGTGFQAVNSDGNLMTLTCNDGTNNYTRFIWDAEGSAHAEVEWTTYDEYCDIELLRGMHGALTPCYRDKFGQDMLYNLCHYEEMGLVGKNSVHWEDRDDGRYQLRGMVNLTHLAMLHHSSIIQMNDNFHAIIQSQEQRINQLETQLALGESNGNNI